MPTLLDINYDLLAFADLLDDAADESGELMPEAAIALEQWFLELGRDRDLKLDNYCALIREMQLRAAARKEEAERLAKRIAVDENQITRLKERLVFFFKEQGLKKVETQRYKISLCNNGGVQPVKVDIAPENLPEEFQLVKITENRDAIRQALQDGKQITGCELLPRGQHIRIS